MRKNSLCINPFVGITHIRFGFQFQFTGSQPKKISTRICFLLLYHIYNKLASLCLLILTFEILYDIIKNIELPLGSQNA